jgi:hypothetical protein
MAPERFRGRGDARADVYSLGLTLYELLVLRPAFDSPDRVALSEQIKAAEPPRPRSLDPRIPRDLETIVLKAIEKDPGDRYVTADAMAQDLRRFLDDEPILARRVGSTERFLRWSRRNPTIAVLGGLLTALLVTATFASVIIARQMASLAGEKSQAAEDAERNLYAARISLAENALHRNDRATAARLLDKCLPKAGGPDRRGWEWSFLDRWCRPELCTLPNPDNQTIYHLAVSPDGRFLVAAGGHAIFGPTSQAKPATVNVYDLADLAFRRTLAGHWGVYCAVAFRPDGGRLATFDADGRVTLWDPETWRALQVFDGGTHSGQPGRSKLLDWSPDGRRLAVRSDERVWIGDPETSRKTAQISESVESLTWSPDGSRIAAAVDGATAVRVLRAEDGTPLGPTIEAGGVVRGLFWTPDGRRLTGFCADGTRKTWDLATGQLLDDRKIVPALDVVTCRAPTDPFSSRVATMGSSAWSMRGRER